VPGERHAVELTLPAETNLRRRYSNGRSLVSLMFLAN
jgi:hypothetical protein